MMQGRNTVEEVLCLSALQGYTVFYRNCEKSNVLSDIVFAHSTSNPMIRTWSYVLIMSLGNLGAIDLNVLVESRFDPRSCYVATCIRHHFGWHVRELTIKKSAQLHRPSKSSELSRILFKDDSAPLMELLKKGVEYKVHR
ncbi:hypothetical protein M9H77_13331 [Catharanthus roseus]|uniref:Uncharacterized protein n=1 Tax=Catharanthus roseus TaxID=4058 RepID=A0ACC0BJU9_CATRO|nr:hypothetical protein M9H77_13331 [Catharanthus roseus]